MTGKKFYTEKAPIANFSDVLVVSEAVMQDTHPPGYQKPHRKIDSSIYENCQSLTFSIILTCWNIYSSRLLNSNRSRNAVNHFDWSLAAESYSCSFLAAAARIPAALANWERNNIRACCHRWVCLEAHRFIRNEMNHYFLLSIIILFFW